MALLLQTGERCPYRVLLPAGRLDDLIKRSTLFALEQDHDLADLAIARWLWDWCFRRV